MHNDRQSLNIYKVVSSINNKQILLIVSDVN